MGGRFRRWRAAALAAAAFGAAGFGPALGAREVEIERIPAPSAAAPDPAAAGEDGPGIELPEVQYDASRLPAPVRRLREQLMEAARSGDVERLRPILEANPVEPVLSFGDAADPIAFLKEQSGDGEGRETLAILLEVLESGFVHVDAGTAEEMYVWPYFARYPVEGLSGPQMVELFTLITAGDYEDMVAFGAYVFYRVGITPDGTWAYFVAGD